MELRNNGVKISCGGCRYVAVDQKGEFEVTVPLGTTDGTVVGTARLRCAVTAESHRVDLVEWSGDDHVPVDAPEDVRRRVADALAFVARQRICGNHQICPAAVIRIVEEHGET